MIFKESSVYLQAKKNNFILHLYLEILQKYCKLVILGTLGMPEDVLIIYKRKIAKTFNKYFLNIALRLRIVYSNVTHLTN